MGSHCHSPTLLSNSHYTGLYSSTATVQCTCLKGEYNNWHTRIPFFKQEKHNDDT